MRNRLKAFWIRLRSGTRIRTAGPGHRVDVSEAFLYGVRIDIGGRGNQLAIGRNTRMWGATIKMRGENLRCSIGPGCRLRETRFVIEDRSSRLIIKAESSGTGCTLLAGEGGTVEIGRDCMMSANSDIRNTDGHSIIDESTGVRINPAADVILEDHVWVGLKAQVLKGVRAGGHSIIAAGSVVIRDVPGHTIVAGIPAREIRSGITWKRERLEISAGAVAVDV
jgi:carbonic anhydrase/acetyltransferase-like protein (isoleucine patch superfamily)